MHLILNDSFMHMYLLLFYQNVINWAGFLPKASHCILGISADSVLLLTRHKNLCHYRLSTSFNLLGPFQTADKIQISMELKVWASTTVESHPSIFNAFQIRTRQLVVKLLCSVEIVLPGYVNISTEFSEGQKNWWKCLFWMDQCRIC